MPVGGEAVSAISPADVEIMPAEGAAAPAPAPEGAPLTTLVQWFLAYQDKKVEEMAEQRTARRYHHATQWTDAERKALDERKQPTVTVNRTARKINGIVGLVERLRQDPKAYPRNPGHEGGAAIATAVLRYICDNTHFPQIRTEVARDIAIDGLGGVEFSVEQTDDGSLDVTIERVQPETFFYDPRSVKPHFGDARYLGVYKWLDLDAAIELMPDKEQELRDALDSSGGGAVESNGLQDWEKLWFDTRLQRVKIVEVWYRWKGEWWCCVHTGTTKLVDSVSPFRDDKGKTISKYEMVSCEIDQDGDRYGFVRNLKGPQDEINHRRSKLLHILNVRQVKAQAGAVKDIERARTELARPDGWLEYESNPEAIEVLNPSVQMQGQAELLAEAKAEIENFGPNPALIGSGGADGIRDASGRAIALMQQAGIAELGPFIVRLRSWGLRCYRLMWALTRQFWRDERYIRVAGDPEEVQFLAINKPMGHDAYGQPVIANAIGELDVDIILDEGPDTVTLRQDVLQQLSQMQANGTPVPPAVLFELSDLPPELKQRLNSLMQPPPEVAQRQQAAQDLELQGKAAEVAKDQAVAMKTHAEANALAQGGAPAMPGVSQPPAPGMAPAAPGMAPMGAPGLAGMGAPDPMAMGQQIVAEAQQAVAEAQAEREQLEADKQALVDAIKAQMDAVKTQKAQAELAIEQQAAKVQADRQALEQAKREIDLQKREIQILAKELATKAQADTEPHQGVAQADIEARRLDLETWKQRVEAAKVQLSAVQAAEAARMSTAPAQSDGAAPAASADLMAAIQQLLAVAQAPTRVTMPDGRVITGQKVIQPNG
jgi:hypothetical protein